MQQTLQPDFLPKQHYWKVFHQHAPSRDAEGNAIAKLELKGVITQKGCGNILSHTRQAFNLKWPTVEEISKEVFVKIELNPRLHAVQIN